MLLHERVARLALELGLVPGPTPIAARVDLIKTELGIQANSLIDAVVLAENELGMGESPPPPPPLPAIGAPAGSASVPAPPPASTSQPPLPLCSSSRRATLLGSLWRHFGDVGGFLAFKDAHKAAFRVCKAVTFHEMLSLKRHVVAAAGALRDRRTPCGPLRWQSLGLISAGQALEDYRVGAGKNTAQFLQRGVVHEGRLQLFPGQKKARKHEVVFYRLKDVLHEHKRLWPDPAAMRKAKKAAAKRARRRKKDSERAT